MAAKKNTTVLGNAGTRRAAALLGIASCAEMINATLVQEAGKIDVSLSFLDPFTGTMRHTPCQVKTGNSYRAKSRKPDLIQLKAIGRVVREKLERNLGLIAWVPLKPSSAVYWFICRPGQSHAPMTFPRQTQRVSPALRYILARELAQTEPQDSVTRQELRAFQNSNVTMEQARKAYKELKAAPVKSPLFGEIRVSRAAWRHITRRGKSAQRRTISLRIVPHLAEFLGARPGSHNVMHQVLSTSGQTSTETRIVVCWYRGGLVIDGQRRTLMLRVKEEISYPTAWYKYILKESDVTYRATLLSWWVKGE
ncbi:MAG: hypothetical protein ACOZE5_18270 [Verrucomicrobiota bacterium]